jgi:hypothetical protein
MKPVIILINPWIYDFAAYDLWSKPLGLLYLGGYLRKYGFDIRLIDCLDVHHPEMKASATFSPPVRRAYGTGKFWKEEIIKPQSLKHISRSYNRYGISGQLFIKELKKIKNPAAILVTSLMTYWYPGVKEAIKTAKEVHPEVPVILGGIYSRLCHEHATQFSGADYVEKAGDLTDLSFILDILKKSGVETPANPPAPEEIPYPAFDMQRSLDYICITTSIGCPYKCKYCASKFLNPKFFRRNVEETVNEINYWSTEHKVRDFAFYDDALLVDSSSHMGLVMEELIRLDLDLRFHTPNALHIREISPEIAHLLYLSGFRTIRLGLESSDEEQHRELDQKVSGGDFEIAVSNLKNAGFSKKDIGAYILMGLPDQSIESIKETINLAGKVGVTPYLAEYSPLPHTALWDRAVSVSGYDLASEPLYHNNSLLPCWDDKKRKKVPELKSMVREIRQDQ